MSARSLRQPVSTASRAGERPGAAAGPSSPRPRHTRCPQGFDNPSVLHRRLRTGLFRSVQPRSFQRSGWRVRHPLLRQEPRWRLRGNVSTEARTHADRSEVLADEGLRSAQRSRRPSPRLPLRTCHGQDRRDGRSGAQRLPYDIPQSWSKAIAEHPTRPDGIAYHARHDDNELCYAIFDRASGCIGEERRTINLDQDWFWRLAEQYGIGLSP